MEQYPPELFMGCRTDEERAARIGRFLILEEMGFFGEPTNIGLASSQGGTFIQRVRRHFSNIYGDVRGCDPADIEVAAEMRGVFDDVFDVEAHQGTKYLSDRDGKRTDSRK